jgi:pimeloyl-ACP methyl ester carboxylesterase
MSRAAALALLMLAACAHPRTARPEAGESSVFRTLSHDGLLLFVTDGGPNVTGRVPIVFVHGLGGDTDTWDAVLARVRKGRRAVALDLRGHGNSDSSEKEAYAMEDFAADVLTVADRAGLERFAIVGYSLGASVAIDVAASQPARVAGLLLLDPTGDLTQAPVDSTDAAKRALRGGERQSFLRQSYEQACGEGDAAKALFRASERAQDAALAGLLGAVVYFKPAKTLARYPGPRLSVESPDGQEPYALTKVIPSLPRQPIGARCAFLTAPDELATRIEAFSSTLDASNR